MDYLEEKIRLKKLRLELDELWEKLEKRRAELRAEDLERRKKEFDKLPLEQRKAREAIGWSPYQADHVTRRIGGSIEIK